MFVNIYKQNGTNDNIDNEHDNADNLPEVAEANCDDLLLKELLLTIFLLS